MKKIISTFVFALLLFCGQLSFSQYVLITPEGGIAPKLERLLNLLHLYSLKTPKEVLNYTQSQFLRKPTQERWHIQKTNFDDKLSEALPIFKELGVINSVEPKEKIYNHLLILGTTIPLMYTKIQWIKKHFENGLSIDKIYFLTGTRPLDLSVDLFPAIDNLPANEKPKNESQAAEWLWNTYVDNKELKEKITFVSVPMIVNADGSIRRPTTLDTIELWLKKYEPQPGKTLSLSKNPFIPYQHAIVWVALKNAQWFENKGTLETVGEAASSEKDYKSNAMGIFLDTLARWFYTEYNAFYGLSSNN